MLNALLIEDDIDLATTIIDYLLLEQIDCDHADNGLTGLHLIKEHPYDVILLDINLPRLSGLHLCARLRTAGITIPVLMLTALDQLDDKIAGFRAGTDDYLVKPFELKELVVRLYALAGRRSGQVQLLRCGDLEMNLNNRTLFRAGQPINLSPTAWSILEILMRASPEVVSRQKILDTVWGDDQPDSNSLKVHLHNLRKAIDSPFKTPLLHTVAGHGVALRVENKQ